MNLFVLIFFIATTISSAAELEVIGPCSSKPAYQFKMGDKFETVADLTFYVFDKNNIPYQGTDKGITSLLNDPVGDEALEVISDTEMRAYGWCYFVNGKVSMAFADETYLKPGDKVQWIYSYAIFDREWKSMCNPSYKLKSDFMCKKNR